MHRILILKPIIRNDFIILKQFERSLLTKTILQDFNRKSSINNEFMINNQKINFIHLSSRLHKEPDSKVDKAFDILKEETPPPLHATDAASSATPIQASSILPRPTLWQRIVAECKHYYHGFKLLYFETKITVRLLRQVLRGHTLTRRERKQLTQTAADLFRLVPFSLFVIVPFLEFTLPIFLKLFPNMLPSTFKEQSKEQEKLKKQLIAKLEMAKFLQDTLEETALLSDKKDADGGGINKKFAEFMKKIRSKGVQPTTEDILKYSAYFENELTLDNLQRKQLIALCQILEANTFGNLASNDMLKFQLRMKIRDLEADDKMIIKEGAENLTIDELQQACRDRGMRAIGVSELRLRTQLDQWLDLHIHRKIPTSLLVLSRALYLPENLAPEELIKSTISALPESIENATLVKIAEATGSKVDNVVKLELLKREDEAIKLEKKLLMEEIAKSEARAVKEEMVTPASEMLVDKAPTLQDKAPIIETDKELLTPKEIKDIGKIIENLTISTQNQVKEDLDELKKDITEYKLDLKQVENIVLTERQIKLGETKSAKILSKRVDKLIKDLDKLVVQIQKEDSIQTSSSATSQPNKNMVSIEEILAAIHQIQGISSEIKEKKILEVLESLDKDHDGKIDDLSDVVKVFELIAVENVKVSKDQLGKILTLLEKEKVLELEEQQQLQEQLKQQEQKQ